MKRYGNLFEKITDINNLVQAHLKARRNSRAKKRREVEMVDKDIIGYCSKLRESLISHKFTTSPYRVFTLCDRGKEREIYDLPYYPDRIVHWAIMLVLEPIFVSHFIATTYAAIPGKKKWSEKWRRKVSTRGTHAAFVKTDEYMEDREGAKYCLKLDVRKYFPNINKDILKALLRKKIKCKDTLWLLDDIIDSSENGVPIGNYTSQYFGNFYLSYFDHWLKEQKHVKYYVRYMDDLVIFHHDKEYLHQLRKDIAEYLMENLGLQLKDNWQVFPTFVRGVDFVGYRNFGDYQYLRRAAKNRLKMVTKRLRQKVNKRRPFTVSDRSKLGAYYGILGWGSCYHLREQTINKITGGLYGKDSKRNAKGEAACPGLRKDDRLRA